jgi:hypothetical protein
MAGYSGTPLPKKLGIKEGHSVAWIDAPPTFEASLGPLPNNITVQRDLRGRKTLDVIVYFVSELSQLQKRFPKLAPRLAPTGGLWIAWPKRTSGAPTDLTEDVIRAVGLEIGLVDNKVCAVDETWSGLRFVVRLKDRPREAGRVR